MASVVDYQVVEDAVGQELLSVFSDILTEHTVGPNFDDVWEAMTAEDRTFGAYLEYGGGQRQRNAPFLNSPGSHFWEWSVICIFIVRYRDSEQVERDAKSVASKAANMFVDNPRLGGVVDWAMINRVDPPEPVRINDIPTYWFGFEVTTFNQLRA